MKHDEITVKIITRIQALHQDFNVQMVRGIIEDVLYDYNITAAEKSLALLDDMQDYINLYIASKRLDGLSELTLYNYRIHLNRFAAFVRKDVTKVEPMDLRRFLAAYSTQAKIKKSTLSTTISTLKSFFNWLVDQEYIEKNPMRAIKSTKTDKRVRQSLSSEELERLRDACQDDRERATVEFFFSTGCRVSEVASVVIGDINWAEMSLLVIGKGNKQRKVYFNPRAKLYMQRYLTGRTNNHDEYPLFAGERMPHGPLTRNGIERMIKRIADQAGIKRPVYPHLLRHTMGTMALRAGASLSTIQALLGHEDTGTTSVYARTDDETVRAEYTKHMAR
jgi:integrase/recombinase XerD